jgi:hypothetical protein
VNARRTLLVAVVCLGLWPHAPVVCASSGTPTDAEREALARLKGQIIGQIVWESNRTGAWNLYTMNADGTGARRLTSDPGNDTQARFSSDGARVLFTRSVPGQPEAVWIMDSDGSGARRLIDNASDAEWRKGDRAVQFLRKPNPDKDVRQTWEYDLATGDEQLLFPPEGVQFQMEIWGATGNDAGTRFVAWSPRPRGTWVLSPDGRLQKLVHPGCEGQVAADQRYAYGVHDSGRFVRFNMADGQDMVPFKERTGAWSHTYFPRVSADGEWLIYGACPPDQHDHATSDYEIFLVPLRNWSTPDEPVRLTFNTRTDRWPDIFVAPAGAADPLPDGPYDTAENVAINSPHVPPAPAPAAPAALTVSSFASDGAKPDWGGDWGLWPQVEGCGGEATWVAEDAEGGEGGSMVVKYDIGAEPRSFSMWFAPGRNVNLSAYDRFVIHARGDVPSFTLVVKDRSADPTGKTDTGIADLLVTGVTGQWQRFELPFADLLPRVAGTAIDWHAVNHVGVAMMADRNATSGTLQVDGLAALPAPVRDPAEGRTELGRLIPDARLLWIRDDRIYHSRLGQWAPQPATGEPGKKGRPRWSPDGTHIAYWAEHPDGTGVWVMAADFSDRRLILPDARVADWTADGNALTAIAADRQQVLKHDLTTGQTSVIFDSRELPYRDTAIRLEQVAELHVSGRYLLIWTEDLGHATLVVDLVNGRYLANERMLGGDCSPAWAPDGSYLVGTARDWAHGRAVVRAAFDAETGSIGPSEYFCGEGTCHSERVSNDGNWVVYAPELESRELFCWGVGEPPGTAVRLTFDAAQDLSPSLFIPGGANAAAAPDRDPGQHRPQPPAFGSQADATLAVELQNLHELVAQLRPVQGVRERFDEPAYFERNQPTLVQLVRLAARLRQQYPASALSREAAAVVERYGLPQETSEAGNEQLTVVAVIEQTSRVPSAAQIAPYRDALTYIRYRVERVVAGGYSGDHLLVVHWGMRDAKPTLAAEWQAGLRQRLIVDLFGAHPELWRVTAAQDADELTLTPYWALSAETCE